jgi:hypothetical protein
VTVAALGIDRSILELRRKELLQTGCGVILAELEGRDQDVSTGVGRLLSTAPVVGEDLVAMVWVIVSLCQRIAVRDGTTPEDVAAALHPSEPADSRAGRMQRSVITAAHAWVRDPQRGYTLALENSGWKQARVEAARVGACLLADFDAADQIRWLNGEIIPVHEPYSLTNIVRDLRHLLRRPRLGTTAAGTDALNRQLLELESDALADADEDDLHFELLQLALLRDDLFTVQNHDTETMRRVRRKLVADEDTFFGARCEVTVAAKLSGSQYHFRYDADGLPDFALTDLPDVGIECTSRHRRDGSNLLRRIEHAIAQKSQKPYASTSTGLVIEITNLQAWSVDRDGEALGGSVLQEFLETQVVDRGLGSVVLLAVLYDHHQRLVHRVVPNRADHPMIDTGLLSVLNRLWPGRAVRFGQISFPYSP